MLPVRPAQRRRGEDGSEEDHILLPAAAPQGRILPQGLSPGTTRRRRLPALRHADPRLAPDWQQPRDNVSGWPDAVPADLRLRLQAVLDRTGPAPVTPEAIWDALRGWLLEHGTDAPAALSADRHPGGADRLRDRLRDRPRCPGQPSDTGTGPA
ncbi:hypothetical protein ruthe_01783 [Rubellimicrobium thermophilum DSM 16684]|uniref:Uncharacterized protein n=1 Tax=Rubellimicrobium thermophilum DSM 16684 TaxID=1123069 RepID=S9QUY6_9RHOB|nr:hypothetical protein [Rubellimicrobium thermophilum]EPX85191.1 hypothetical protein ruthe_01783 [Rubellimicrobium thermophilum DSM 16684]